jgi:hypothetical protein
VSSLLVGLLGVDLARGAVAAFPAQTDTRPDAPPQPIPPPNVNPEAIRAPQELVQWRDLPGFQTAAESSLPSEERLRAAVVSPEIAQLVSALESDEWVAREAASRALVAEPFADEELLALLSRGALSAESHHRLLDIVCERLATLPRGAIGIRMDLADGAPGATIQSLIDDMPAKTSGLLRPGDRILALNGRPVTRTRTQFSVIQVERPGQTVRLTIEREAPRGAPNLDRPLEAHAAPEHLEIDLVLGSAEQLDRLDLAGWGGGSRSAQVRGAQVREARERFSPAVLDVPVARRSVLDPSPIDEHPELREMLFVRERVAAGDLEITPAMRAAWFQTLALLETKARDPEASEPAREFHRRVARRYAELMPR